MMNDESRLSRLRGYLRADPTNLALACDALDCAIGLRDVDTADSLLKETFSVHGEVPPLLYRKGALALVDGQSAEAREVFQRMQESDTDNAVLVYMIALTHFEEHDLEPALKGAEAALAISATTSGALGLALRAAHLLGKFDEARSLLERFSAVIDADADALGVASLVALDMVDLDRARHWSGEALKHNSGQLEALVTAGTLMLLEGRDAEAKAFFERAIERRDNVGRAWAALGLVRLRAGDTEPAAELFLRALQTVPMHIGTWHSLGWCRTLQGKLEEARDCFDKALELDRNFAESHGAQGVVSALLGERSRAQASVERAFRLDSRCVSAQFAKAMLSGQIADSDSLRRFARRFALSHGPFAINRPPGSQSIH